MQFLLNDGDHSETSDEPAEWAPLHQQAVDSAGGLAPVQPQLAAAVAIAGGHVGEALALLHLPAQRLRLCSFVGECVHLPQPKFDHNRCKSKKLA